MYAKAVQVALILAVLTVVTATTHAGYRPIWVLQEQLDVVVEGTNVGLRSYVADSGETVHTYVFTVATQYPMRVDVTDTAPAVGDTILVVGRGTWLRDDRARYLLFLRPEQRRGHLGLPWPLYEGTALPCERFQALFSQGPADCSERRQPSADHCACARATVLRYAEVLAARTVGGEVGYLHESLSDPNPLIVLSAMGLLRTRGTLETPRYLAPLVDNPEVQVRYDLAESLPRFPDAATGEIGVRLLDDPDTRVQLLAAYGLGRLGYAPAAPTLAAVLADPQRDRMVRSSCLAALDKMGSPLLVPALEQAVAAGPDSVVAGYAKHLDKLQRREDADE